MGMTDSLGWDWAVQDSVSLLPPATQPLQTAEL
jgi:hypothetical protein